MKIKVTVTLDVDPEAWVLNYGIERAEVRDDVKTYFEHVCREQLIAIDCENKSED